MSRFRFGILGGDYRYKLLYDGLVRDGYSVKAYGNTFMTGCEKALSELFEGVDILIGPIPLSKDDRTAAVSGGSVLTLDDLFEEMDKNNIRTLIAGVISSDVAHRASEYDIKTHDFFEREEVAVYNAIPTAEGAISTAIQESDVTLFGSKTLVMGYGRCGKVLANMLKGLGADVYSTYRNEKTAAFIKAFGIKGFDICELKSRIHSFDYIFNTIPCEILTKEVLKNADKRCLIIDLAQAPGGTDFNFARDLNIRALYCPGLPGRTAPLTAAEILKKTILNIALRME